VHFAEGGADAEIDAERSAELLDSMLAELGSLRRVLLLPPDATRRHSGAGEITSFLYQRLAGRAEVDVLPTLGTHAPMSAAELGALYPGIPLAAFLVHDFRKRLLELGQVPASFVEHVSGGLVSYPVRCEVNAALVRGRYDRIISIGQLVPHEVVGIANHNKNVFVGAGGKAVIDRTHFLGAVCGMERIMGRAQTPVRAVLDYMSGQLAGDLPPITYVLTVRQRDAEGALHTRGLYAGDDEACFHAGVPLVQRVNMKLLETPPKKVVVYLDPAEFKSTWLGNKAIYRTRLAIADRGELVILAPGVRSFGEDPGIDRLIRKHGYRGSSEILARVKSDPELGESLSAAAHLIHGSSEGRFSIRYATGGLDQAAVEAAGYEYGDLTELGRRYDPARLREGVNRLADGEEIFFISNPALGLWGLRTNFPGT
jgi:nickel-dependent lactate racemase